MSQEQVQSEAKTIKLSEVIALMDQGKTRKEINAIYGETDAAMKAKVWSHPKLKNKKSAKVVNITLEDDTEESVTDQGLATEADHVETIYEPAAENVEAPVVDDTNTSESDLAQADVEAEVTTDAPVADAATPLPTERGTW